MDRQASLFHVTGLSKIIQSCEPTKFGTLPLRSAFESARTTLVSILAAVKTRDDNHETVYDIVAA